ncbi:Ger(x)C family spore germination protein [Cohnella sp. GCM10012308]|uniref:Ger(x)C family spore germination protein n=1 Tax=Cohnella sp. GCM10012308 TaxID=3317329 RepID=UPI0036102C38
MRKRRVARYTALKLLAALAFLAGTTGCWSKQELNDRTFVTTLMVDLTEQGETEITTMFILPNRISVGLGAAPGSQKPYVAISGKGRDIAEAFQQIQKDLPRNVAWGQMRAVIVGDRYARAGLAPLFDYFIRATDFRLRVYLFYFNGEARNLSRLTPVFERFPTEIWRESAHTKRIPPVNLRDLLSAQWNNLGDGYIPELSLHELELLTEHKSVAWSGVGGAALMKDGAVVDRFTPEEAAGISLLKNNTPEMVVASELPEGGFFSVKLLRVQQKTRAIRRGGKVVIQVSIRGHADLVSVQAKVDLSSQDGLRTLERALNKRILQLAQSAADKAQEERADAYQWSEYLRYKYPSLWPKEPDHLREELFLRMKPDIHVDIVLRSTGISRSPMLKAQAGGLEK